MAGDWIKVEKATPDKPEIRHIARACEVSIGEAFAAWFRLWCYLDCATADGEVRFLKPEDCDDVARLPGIGEALSHDHGCGWIVFHARGATVANWDRHIGESAKQRALATDRKRKQRRETTDKKDHSRW